MFCPFFSALEPVSYAKYKKARYADDGVKVGRGGAP